MGPSPNIVKMLYCDLMQWLPCTPPRTPPCSRTEPRRWSGWRSPATSQASVVIMCRETLQCYFKPIIMILGGQEIKH